MRVHLPSSCFCLGRSLSRPSSGRRSVGPIPPLYPALLLVPSSFRSYSSSTRCFVFPRRRELSWLLFSFSQSTGCRFGSTSDGEARTADVIAPFGRGTAQHAAASARWNVSNPDHRKRRLWYPWAIGPRQPAMGIVRRARLELAIQKQYTISLWQGCALSGI